MKEPKQYELPPKDCWAEIGEKWVKAELIDIDYLSKVPYKVVANGVMGWTTKITYENPTEKRLPTKAELVELLKKHPQLRVCRWELGCEGGLYIWEGPEFENLNEYEFTLDLGDTFHSFERDWSEEL